MRERGADLGPPFAGLAVALVLFDGEDVQVGERGQLCLNWCGSGCRVSVRLLLIAIVQYSLSLSVWTFIARNARAMVGKAFAQ